MPQVAIAFSAIAGSFTATALGQFLTTTIGGRLLSSVALSALKSVIVGKPKNTQPGLRNQQTLTGGITAASFILGIYATGGQLLAPPMSHGEANGVPSAYLTYAIELGDIPGQTLNGLILDGETVEIGSESHEDYGQEIGGRFQGKAWVKYHDGTQTAADPMLIDKYGADPERPWTTDMIGAGICYAVLTFLYDREVFSAFPNVRFVMGGIPLYDPRKDTSVGGSGSHRWADKSTWEQSENVAVQAYNIKRGIDLGGGNVWGGNIDAEDLPLAVWWAEMNRADVAVAIGTTSDTEPQYRASYEVFVEDEPASILEDLLRGSAGMVAEVGGVWKIRLGGPSIPVFQFTDEDIIVSETAISEPFSDATEPLNGVQANFPDPEGLWEPKDAPAIYDATLEAEDGKRNVGSLTLGATPYSHQVQRVMQGYLDSERRFRRHQLSLPADAVPLEPLDVVEWFSEEHGYMGKQFEVRSIIDPMMTGTPRLSLIEVDPSDHDAGSILTQTLTNVSTARAVLAVQGVDGFDAQPAFVADADGTAKIPGVRLLWNGNQPDVRGVQWEVRIPNGATVNQGSTQAVALGEQLLTDGLLPGSDFQARTRFLADRATAWSAWVTVTTPNARPGIQDLASGVGGNLLVNTEFSHPANPLNGTLLLGVGAVGGECSVSVREHPQDYASPALNSVRILQVGSATTGSSRLSFTVLDDATGAFYYPVIEAGQTYDFSANLALRRCTARLVIEWYDADRAYISQTVGETISAVAVSLDDPDSWARIAVTSSAPADAMYGRAYVEKFGTDTGSNSFVVAAKPMFAKTHAGATEPTPYDPKRDAYFDGNLAVNGSVSALALDAASMRVSGQAFFGSLASTNFDGVITNDAVTDPGTLGFAITRTGDAVFNNLITRNSLVDGSVSDGDDQNLTGPATVLDQAYVFPSFLAPGAILTNQFWHVACYAEIRRLGDVAVSNPGGGPQAPFTNYSIKQTRLVLEFRGYKDGGWEDWIVLWTTPMVGAATYLPVELTAHIQGNFTATNLRLRVDSETASSGYVEGIQQDYSTIQDNIRNASLVMKAVVK